ncbi:MAG: glycerophosphodiester phosphodiesterase [Dehalococcoidia bacterium]|nr:glycerophosphodiester phosphodiesterase [Dehalococcoidia bacterium]
MGAPAGVPEPGQQRPMLIAHGAGNTREAALTAVGLGADLIEVDLWVHRRQFEARHERRLPLRAPVLYEQWYLSRPRRDAMTLPELIDICKGRSGIFLDLKGGGDAVVDLLRDQLGGSALPLPVAASAQHWPVLREVGRRLHQIAPFYSIDVLAKLDLFLSVMRRDPIPVGISCRHELLDQAVVERCHEEGVAVVAWTVDEPSRALELVAMGVDAITTHAIAVLRAELGLPSR